MNAGDGLMWNNEANFFLFLPFSHARATKRLDATISTTSTAPVIKSFDRQIRNAIKQPTVKCSFIYMCTYIYIGHTFLIRNSCRKSNSGCVLRHSMQFINELIVSFELISIRMHAAYTNSI